VRHPERALIRYAADQVDAVHLIAQVALAWPVQKMAVVATRIDRGRQVRDRLRAYGLDAVSVNSENQPPEVGPVVVCTPAGLSHLPVNVAWLDIVLVLDARRSRANSAWNASVTPGGRGYSACSKREHGQRRWSAIS
jgi:hypothetical protein